MKQYLNELTAQEVIEKLKAGETLQNTNNQRLEYIDGFLIGYKDNDWFLYPSLSSTKLNLFYFERPEPELKIEIGKFYATRDGKKAYVFSKNSEDKYCVAIEGEGVYTVFEGGYYSEESETDGDLISLWEKEPLKKEKIDTKEVVKLLREGKTYDYISEHYGLNRVAISKLKRKNGLQVKVRPSLADRKEKYRKWLEQGISIAEIGRRSNLCANSVYAYISSHKDLYDIFKARSKK